MRTRDSCGPGGMAMVDWLAFIREWFDMDADEGACDIIFIMDTKGL